MWLAPRRMGVLNDPELEKQLARLHADSEAQNEALGAYFAPRYQAGVTEDFERGETRAFLADKLVALEAEKAEFCYQLCRALNAQRIVEAGTSFGVSTLYLAAAVRDNGGGVVIGTEFEPGKAATARANFKSASLDRFIELREGDLRETLRNVDGPIDFMLIDIWTPLARPALEHIAPKLRPGAVVICDNTGAYRDHYEDYFAFITSHGGLRTMTLPFPGGLEMTVRVDR